MSYDVSKVPSGTRIGPQGPDGRMYEVVVCGEDNVEGETCLKQVQRDWNCDWRCDSHGRCEVVRFCEVQAPVVVVL